MNVVVVFVCCFYLLLSSLLSYSSRYAEDINKILLQIAHSNCSIRCDSGHFFYIYMTTYKFCGETMSRKCLTDSDSFHFVCGEFTLKAQRQELMPLIKKPIVFWFQSGRPRQNMDSTQVLYSLWLLFKGKKIIQLNVIFALFKYQVYHQNKSIA